MRKNLIIENILRIESTSVRIPNIMDEPVPEINIPILKPQPKSYFSSIITNLQNQVKNKIIDFERWISPYIPKTIVKKLDKKLEKLKKDIDEIYKKKQKNKITNAQNILLLLFRIRLKLEKHKVLYMEE